MILREVLPSVVVLPGMNDRAVIHGRARSRIIHKIVTSLVIGGATYLVTELTDQPRIWSITLSIFIGGVALVVHFLAEFESRLTQLEVTDEANATKVIDMISTNIAKTNRVTELFTLLERSALRTDAVAKLVQHAALIEPAAPPLVSRLAESEVLRLSDFLRKLSEGASVVYDGEDRDWLLTLTKEASLSIDAVSLASVDGGSSGWGDGGFWVSDLGQRFLDAQADAVRRGVQVRRVFVLHGDDEDASHNAGLAYICQLQKDVGIQVRLFDSASAPGSLRNKFYGVVLFDGAISYEVSPASLLEDNNTPTILSTRLDLSEDRVALRKRYFQDLWESSRDFT